MSLIKNLALVVLSTCFSLALVELGLRVYYPFSIDVHSSREITNVDLHDEEHYFCQGPHRRFEPHDSVMYLEQSNGAFFEFRNDGVNFFASNQHGFRGVFSPPEGRTARLVLGDSFAWGSLADETESIPALLSRWSQDYHYANLGTGGHGTLQHELVYQEFGKNLDHNLVVMLVYIPNDLGDNVTFREWQEKRGAGTGPDSQSQRVGLVDSIKASLRPLQTYKLVGRFKDRLTSRRSTVTARQKMLFEESLITMKRSVESSGAELMVFALPGVAEFTDETTTRKDPVGYADEVRALIADLAERNGFLWFDIKPSLLDFADQMNVEAVDLYGSPDTHLTEVGYYAASRIIAQEIQDRNKDSMDVDEVFVNRTTFDPRDISCPEIAVEAK